MRATATLLLQDAVGSYTLSAVFAGDAAFRRSSDSRDFSITPIPTTLTVTGGAAETVSATLTRAASGTPMPQQTVVFSVVGPVTKQLAATTDPAGRAQVPVGDLPNGTYIVTARYDGTPSTFLATVSLATPVTLATAGPTLTNVKLTPVSYIVGGTTKLTASVADPAGVSRVEYFVGTDPGVSFATPATFAAGAVSVTFGSNLAVGTYTVGVRALDALGNWSATSTTTLTVLQMGLSVSTNANRTGACRPRRRDDRGQRRDLRDPGREHQSRRADGVLHR